MEYVKWTRMEDGTQQDYELLFRLEEKQNADLVDRLFAHLRLGDVDWGGYQITRYQHSLQSATLALRDDADEEMVVAALFHDIGDAIAPYNHSELAAAVLKPYVSERVHWIIKHHGVFQSYYYAHHLNGDRNAREKFKSSPYYEDCIHFCHNYDQNAFDPDYDTLPLEAFEPMVRRVFSSSRLGHLEIKSE